MTINRFDRKKKSTAFAVFAVVLTFSFGLSHSRLHMTLEPSGSSRWRNDNGTETTATFAAAEDTALAGLAPGAAARLRFAAGNDGAQSELVRKAATVLESAENTANVAVADVANGYVYFGLYESYPGTVVKVSMNGGGAPIRVGSVILNEGEENIYSAVIDAGNGYAYFGTDSVRGRVVKVALGVGDAPPTRVGALTLDVDEGELESAVIDAGNGYAYFGTSTYPSRVIKVALGAGAAPPTRVGALTLDVGEKRFISAVSDATNGYAYFGTDTNPGRVVKVALGAGADPPTRVGAVTLDVGESYLLSAAIDATHGYAYFGTDTDPGIVIKVALNGDLAPTRVGAVTFDSGEKYLYSAAIDVDHGYIYMGADTYPGRVIKVALGAGAAPPTRIGGIMFNIGEENIYSAVIDATNGYAYFATNKTDINDYDIIVKVRLGAGDDPPVRVGAVSLNAGESVLYSGVIDPENGYAYFGSCENYVDPGRVIKIALGAGDDPPTRVGALTLNAGEGCPVGAGIDTANGYAYFGTKTAPGIVVKVALGAGADPPTRVGAVTLAGGEEYLNSAVIDAGKGYAYFGTSTSPGIVVKVALGAGAAAPTRVDAVTLAVGEDYLASAVIDTAAGYAYFGTNTPPGIVVKVALGTGSDPPTRAGALTLNEGEDWLAYGGAVIDLTNSYIYFGTARYDNNPATIIKLSIALRASFRLEYAHKVTTCADVADWTQVPAVATTEAWEMFASPNLTDGEATTDNAGLTNPAATFVAGYAKTADSQTAVILLPPDNFTELEYSIKSTTNAAAGTTYCFRLTDAGTVTPLSNAVYAEATVAAATTRHSPAAGAPSAPPGLFTPPGAKRPVVPAVTSATYHFTNQGNATSFKLVEDKDDGTRREITSVDDPAATSITEHGLTPNTRYSGRRVIPYNDRGEGAASPIYPTFFTLEDSPKKIAAGFDNKKGVAVVVALGSFPNLRLPNSGIKFFNNGLSLDSGWLGSARWETPALKSGKKYGLWVQTRNQEEEESPPVELETEVGETAEPHLVLKKGIEITRTALSVPGETGEQLIEGGEGLNAAALSPLAIDLGEEKAIFAYRVTATNDGTMPAYVIKITDPIPDGLEYVPGSVTVDGSPMSDVLDGDAAFYDGENALIVVNLESVDPGAMITIDFSARLSKIVPEVKNKATATYSDIKP